MATPLGDKIRRLRREQKLSLDALAAAAGLCPDMKEYGNLLGVAHFKTGDYAKAAEAFRAVLRVDKGSAMDLANLGLCEKFMGNAEQAREYLSAALELDASLDFARTVSPRTNP